MKLQLRGGDSSASGTERTISRPPQLLGWPEEDV